MKIYIVYTDSRGETTNRTVSVGRFDGAYISGYCSLRKAYRTFRLDRIKELADASTGETKKDACAYFTKLYKNSGSYESDMIFDKYYEFLRFIKYFVYVDFDYAEEEKARVREIIRSLDGAQKLSDDNIDALIEGVEIPSLHSFRMVVGKVIKMKKLPAGIIDMIENLAEADGIINDYEKNTIEYIKQRLSKSENR